MKSPFKIRDLFWLILVLAMAIGWWLDHQSRNERIEESYRKEVIELRSNLKSAQERAARLERLLPPLPKDDGDPFK